MTGTTLKEISKALGLSISTVSRALKNHPDISKKTKEKVAELAKTLDYEPNVNAINLKTKNNRLFGIIVPSISNFFYDSFIAAVEEASRQQQYSVMILQSGDDSVAEEENLRLCRQNRVSGVFACLSSNTKKIEPFLKLKEQRIPLIFFDKVPPENGYNKVCVADEASAVIAAKELINAKKKHIVALFGNKNLSITQKRMHAFVQQVNQSSLPCSLTLEYCNNALQAYQETKKFLQVHPRADAFFCMSDEILCGTMKAIQEQKLAIPDHVAVIAISNGFFPTLYSPEITYVETSGYQLGKAAFVRMMECLEDNLETKESIINATLVRGQSI